MVKVMCTFWFAPSFTISQAASNHMSHSESSKNISLVASARKFCDPKPLRVQFKCDLARLTLAHGRDLPHRL